AAIPVRLNYDRTVPGHSLRAAATPQESWLHRSRCADAGAGNRSEYSDFQRGERRVAPPARIQRRRPAGPGLACSASKEFSWNDHILSLGSELSRLAKSEPRLREEGVFTFSRLPPARH